MKRSHVLAALAVAAMVSAAPARAMHAVSESAAQAIPLNDGATLYLFSDGKMAREDRWGRPQRTRIGDVVQAKDGRQITVSSDEVARLYTLHRRDHSN